MAPKRAWHENASAQCISLVQWHDPSRENAFDLVVVNMSGDRAQCRAPIDVPGFEHGTWTLKDRLGDEVWYRDGGEMSREGLWLDLGPRAAQIFSFTR